MNHDLICLFQARALLHMIHLRVAIRRLCRAALCCCPPCRCHAARLATTTLPALPPPRCPPRHHHAACLAAAALPALPPPHCPPRHHHTACLAAAALPALPPPHCPPRRHHAAHLAATTPPTSLPQCPPCQRAARRAAHRVDIRRLRVLRRCAA